MVRIVVAAIVLSSFCFFAHPPSLLSLVAGTAATTASTTTATTTTTTTINTPLTASIPAAITTAKTMATTTSMNAVVAKSPGGPEVLEMGEAPMPIPGPTEVLIRVQATAVNRADTLQRKGLYNPPPGSVRIFLVCFCCFWEGREAGGG